MPTGFKVLLGGSGNGVDATGRFRPLGDDVRPAAPAQHHVPPDGLVVGFVRHITRDKGCASSRARGGGSAIAMQACTCSSSECSRTRIRCRTTSSPRCDPIRASASPASTGTPRACTRRWTSSPSPRTGKAFRTFSSRLQPWRCPSSRPPSPDAPTRCRTGSPARWCRPAMQTPWRTRWMLPLGSRAARVARRRGPAPRARGVSPGSDLASGRGGVSRAARAREGRHLTRAKRP